MRARLREPYLPVAATTVSAKSAPGEGVPAKAVSPHTASAEPVMTSKAVTPTPVKSRVMVPSSVVPTVIPAISAVDREVVKIGIVGVGVNSVSDAVAGITCAAGEQERDADDKEKRASHSWFTARM